MKIIKEGYLGDAMQVTCNTCKAVLEVSSSDLTAQKKLFDSGRVRQWAEYRCPCCDSPNTLEWNEITVGVINALRKNNT